MKFIGQNIEVKTAEERLEPEQFLFQGRWHKIVEVRMRWFDVGHGATPLRRRNWRTRHHRKHFVVRIESGELYHLYLDYQNRARPDWVLAKSLGHRDDPVRQAQK